MKNVKLLATKLLMLVVLFSCNKDDDKKSSINPDLIGIWDVVQIMEISDGSWQTPQTDEYFDFKDDGTFIHSGNHNGTYKQKGKRVTAKYSTTSATLIFDILSLTNTDLHCVTLLDGKKNTEYKLKRRSSAGGFDNDTGSNYGKITFWIQSDLGCGENITVNINGTSQKIIYYYSDGIGTECDVTGCANFTLAPGTYNYSTSSPNGGANWNGTVNITAGECINHQLTGGCNGSGGGGGGGGAGYGKITFWVQSNFGCGDITVEIDGISQTISSYYTNGIDECGVPGCANFTLAPGDYSFYAYCSTISWQETVNVQEGGCLMVKLLGE